jgi:hypothetical protein
MCLATVLSYEMMQQQQGETEDPASCSFSALFQYYNERDLEGLVDCDAGSSLGQSISVYNAHGAAPAALWPYVETKFRVRPSPEAFTAALPKRRRTLRQKRLPKDAETIMSLLSKNKILLAGTTTSLFIHISNCLLPQASLFTRALRADTSRAQGRFPSRGPARRF